MNNRTANQDYVELLKELGLEFIKSEEERARVVDVAIKEIKRVKESLFKRYLDGEISYIQYKENIAQYFKGENPEKVIANIYKKIQINEHTKKSEIEPRQLILQKNLKKRRTDAIIVSVAIIVLLIFGGSLFLNPKSDGITGFFAIDENIINSTPNLTSNLTPYVNQSETLDDETPISSESPLSTDVFEEPGQGPAEAIEQNADFPGDVEDTTIKTDDFEINNTIYNAGEENQTEESESMESVSINNDTLENSDSPLVYSDNNGEQDNQSIDTANETVLSKVPSDGSEENETITIELNQTTTDSNTSQTTNESDTIMEEIGSSQTSMIDLNQSSDGNESVVDSEIPNTAQNLTNKENETGVINATPDYTLDNLKKIENQTIVNTSENETNITISNINQTGIVFETLAIKNDITHVNLSQFSSKSLTFLAVGTNDTAVVVVNEILEVSPIKEIDSDLIKIKEYAEGIIFEFLLNITFVDKETYLAYIREHGSANQTVEANETTNLNDTEGIENLSDISDILNNTEVLNENQNYITPVTLIPFQGIEIDLINATNASMDNNGFLETAVRGIDTRINNNTLLLSYNYPEQTQDFVDTMKIYLIKEEGIETYYLNITLRSTGIFKSKIGSITTTNRTVSINAYEFLEGGTCDINCTNKALNVVDLGNCNFLIENQRSVPIIDYCYLESDFEGEKVRQYFDLSLSVADIGFSETQIILDNATVLAPKEVSHTKELSLPIQFEEQKAIVFDGNQNIAFFNTEISPDNYEVVLLYETEIDNQTYQIAQIAQEVNLSDEGLGITGAFIGVSRAFGSVAEFVTDIIMVIIRFFGGGITGRFTEEIGVEKTTDAVNETLLYEDTETTMDGTTPEAPYNLESISTALNTTDNEGNQEESETITAHAGIEDASNEEDISISNEQNETSDNATENIIVQEDSEENASQAFELNTTEENIAFENASDNNLSSEAYEGTLELNQGLQNQTIDYQEDNGDNNTTTMNESGFVESSNQTDYNVTDDYLAELNESLELGQNDTLNDIQNYTPDKNLSADENLSTEEDFENLSPSPSPAYEEVLNESGEKILYEPVEEPEIEEQSMKGQSIEGLNDSTNQTALEIEAIKEALSKEIEGLQIYSRYDSRNNSILVYYTANSTPEGLDTSKVKIAVRYYANKISYTQNITEVNEFVDQYAISIKNPYLFDFEGMQLTIDINTTKSKFYSRGHFTTLISDYGLQKRVLLSNINLQKGSENIILLEASSPTFEFERSDLGEITSINIFNYLEGELELSFIGYDGSTKPHILFECNNNSLNPLKGSNNSYSISLEVCEGSNLTITANKKEVKGVYGKLLGYHTYIDLSSVILKIPENIFLRSNCDDCVVESLCNPATFCPQSNVGLKDWSFVADLEFNISDTQDILLNSAIKGAELCLYNIYSGDLEGSTLSLGFTNNTNCSRVSFEDDIKALLQSHSSKEFKTAHMILESQSNGSNSSKWVCIDVKSAALDYILSGEGTFVTRVIGSDLSGTSGSFSCFDSGLLPNENCKEFGIFGCSPYLNITYEYLD